MVNEVEKIISSAASNIGFEREKYISNNVISNLQDVIVVVYFGEFDHLFVFNNLILPELKQTGDFQNKYVIFITWKGFGNLIKNVDEVWSLKSEQTNEKLYEKTDGFNNNSELYTVIIRNLNEHFRNVIKAEKYKNRFHHGFNFNYYKNIQKIKLKKYSVTNYNYLNKNAVESILKKYKDRRIFIIPFKFIRTTVNGKTYQYKVSKNLWINIIKRFIQKDFFTIVLKNSFTYDLSSDYSNEDSIYFVQDENWNNIMSYMSMAGISVDIFNGLSCFAQYSDCFCVSVVERSYYNNMNVDQVESLITPFDQHSRKLFSFFKFFSQESDQNLLYIDQLIRVILSLKIKSVTNLDSEFEVDLKSFLERKTKKYFGKLIGYKKINQEKSDGA